jgi:glycine/D-amino acid oxidase-like deaminating enzyme
MTSSDYKIIKEEVGIRPSVKDRRPLIGNHKEHKNYFIFNGMGSRGCFMAPLLAKEFIAFTEEHKPLHPEVDLNRFND